MAMNNPWRKTTATVETVAEDKKLHPLLTFILARILEWPATSLIFAGLMLVSLVFGIQYGFAAWLFAMGGSLVTLGIVIGVARDF